MVEATTAAATPITIQARAENRRRRPAYSKVSEVCTSLS